MPPGVIGLREVPEFIRFERVIPFIHVPHADCRGGWPVVSNGALVQDGPITPYRFGIRNLGEQIVAEPAPERISAALVEVYPKADDRRVVFVEAEENVAL